MTAKETASLLGPFAARMSEAPDFRLEHSELRGDDEFIEFATTDLPYYSDWRGAFEKLAWATRDDSLRGAEADVASVGAPAGRGPVARPGLHGPFGQGSLPSEELGLVLSLALLPVLASESLKAVVRSRTARLS